MIIVDSSIISRLTQLVRVVRKYRLTSLHIALTCSSGANNIDTPKSWVY